jgi:hypothetical protein
MISSAVAALNLGSAPHARAAADEYGTAGGGGSGGAAGVANDGVANDGAANDGAANDGAANDGFASAASEGRAVLVAVGAGLGDDARVTAPGAPAPASAATAPQAAITAASASRLPTIT